MHCIRSSREGDDFAAAGGRRGCEAADGFSVSMRVDMDPGFGIPFSDLDNKEGLGPSISLQHAFSECTLVLGGAWDHSSDDLHVSLRASI